MHFTTDPLFRNILRQLRFEMYIIKLFKLRRTKCKFHLAYRMKSNFDQSGAVFFRIVFIIENNVRDI